MMVCNSVNEYDNCVHSIWKKGQLMLAALNREPLGTLNSQLDPLYRTLYCCIVYCVLNNSVRSKPFHSMNKRNLKNEMNYIIRPSYVEEKT